MARKLFREHLKAAVAAPGCPNISQVKAGEDDGMIDFIFTSGSVCNLKITASVPDVSEYPDLGYYLFTESDENCPLTVSSALESIQGSLSGFIIPDMLAKVSNALSKAISKYENQTQTDSDDDLLEEEEEDEYDDEFDDDSLEDTGAGISSVPRLTVRNFANATAGLVATPVLASRLSSDLRKTKDAGLKVGILGDPLQGGFVCVSCRIMKLGISEEAMRAWSLRRNQYLVLLIQYVKGYKTLQQISEDPKAIGMRVGLCRRYKPSLDEAFHAFTEVAVQQGSLRSSSLRSQVATNPKSSQLEALFIGSPLKELLNDHLPTIILYRLSYAFNWEGAEKFQYDSHGSARSAINPDDQKYNVEEARSHAALPPIVIADHIGEMGHYNDMSFPLVAMQFVFRHFVRCTEFCLVCHCRIDAQFEALKPYVCSKPLCLYQYMSLGFGPRIEYEILSQPAVVDLLVSFCYVSAQQARLNDFPQGIGLQVPHNSLLYGGVHFTFTEKDEELQRRSSFRAKFNRHTMELLFPDKNGMNPLRVGEWVVVNAHASREGPIHARVNETVYWPKVGLGQAVVPAKHEVNDNDSQTRHGQPPRGGNVALTPAPTPPIHSETDSIVSQYSENFDDLIVTEKRAAIVTLLNTLPDVRSMKTFLEDQPRNQDPSLGKWRERISKSALDVLRWIIASNRSCIIQVDQLKDFESTSAPGQAVSAVHGTAQNPIDLEDVADPSDTVAAEERVSGMNGWLQFRFAQGAPDKEQRFVDSVDDARTRLGLQHPTLFAWHGSPLQNWHSIIREGLHFNDTLHGRAFGHGVYMSNQYNTSLGYSGFNSWNNYNSGHSWPRSCLKISTVLSLQEVVNAPAEYVSRHPHYVVAQLDWIQTRYLFVKSSDERLAHSGPQNDPSQIFAQDPQASVTGEHNSHLKIPITAVSKSRRPVQGPQPHKKGSKKIKMMTQTNQKDFETAQDDAASDRTDAEDIAIVATESGNAKSSIASNTDFVPGVLDYSSLPLIQSPSDASLMASKAIQHCFKSALESQKKTPLHLLGWYIDAEKTDNMYQWIVELHTFDPALPLAKDMKKAGIKSVVLEIRFTSSFPYSPPFVRVIRPRFLPFSRGGGGHVTAGGAICMDFLTASGWSSVSDIESVLLNVKMAISSTDPHPARLESISSMSKSDYSTGEAVQAYKTACITHGWKIPEDFNQIEAQESRREFA
ncbi:MAG: hypothetical protein Q9227_007645 [Pyrenula ochraceoflavens]